ncbi:MAG: hypothetical protein SGPRY_014959, partial [Prymnesium sp.]
MKACSSIEDLALSRWRSAKRESMFWSTLGGERLDRTPPNVLLQAVCRGPDESLTEVFRGFVAALPDLEYEA